MISEISLKDSLDNFITIEKLLGSDTKVRGSVDMKSIYIFKVHIYLPIAIIKKEVKELHFYSIGPKLSVTVDREGTHTKYGLNNYAQEARSLLLDYRCQRIQEFDVFYFDSDEDLIRSFNKISHLISQNSRQDI